MTKRRFTPWVVLACIGTLAACTSGEGGTAGNTELNVIVPTNAGTPDEIDIQSVEYTIACTGNSDTFLDNNDSFADEVRIDGNLEVTDGQTATTAGIPPEFGTPRPGDRSEIWQGFMDLPPGPCNIQLRARDGDGEVICTTDEGFLITADATAKVNLVLLCMTSFQAPVGNLDVDATFSFNVGNFCPDLFVLNCIDTDPVPAPLLPPPNPEIAATTCEVRLRDGDSTCGQGCDPQDCTPTLSGLFCVPGPDPGVKTTITCTDSGGGNTALLDCSGDGVPDASCEILGDQTGVLPEFLDGAAGPPFPLACTSDAFCQAAIGALPDAVCVGGFCDFSATNPRLNASFVVACAPPGPPFFGTPGATITCTAVTTDGDNDCDKTKTVTVDCPGLSPCTVFGGDAACVAAADNVCVSSVCDETTCDGTTAGACCDNTNVADGTDCAGDPSVPAGPATCQAGVCTSEACTTDAQCDLGDRCTFFLCCVPGSPSACAGQPLGECLYGQNPCTDCCGPRTCDAASGPLVGAPCLDHGDCGTGLCEPGAAPWPGFCPGTLGGTPEACEDNCAPGGVPVDCSDSDDCTQDVCTSVGGPTCSNPFEPSGTSCDAGGGNAGSCDGAGTCVFVPSVTIAAASTDITVGCTNNVTGDISILTFTLDTGAFSLSPNTAFTTSLDGIGAFVETFLDAAQAVVPGGVKLAQLFDLAATVAVRSGATGPDVTLAADTSTLLDLCQLTSTPCDPTQDNADGSNPGCIPVGTFNLCQTGFAVVPIINGSPNTAGGCTQPVLGTPVPDCDCSSCEALDASTCRAGDPDFPCTKGDQCALNGYCVNGDLNIDLLASSGTWTAGPSGTPIFMGWYDGLIPPVAPALLSLPPAVFANPTPPVGLRVSAGGLFVALQCLMGEDSGGPSGIATCLTGSNAGLPCEAPGRNACNDGADAGGQCNQSSLTACTFAPAATIGCVNSVCGSTAGVPDVCSPPDLASTTPSSALFTFTAP